MGTKHLQQKTYMAKRQKVERKWLLFDARGKVLGRLASQIAQVLRGKHKPDYTPHADTGDGVIVINAGEVRLTGAKEAQKIYRHYTGQVGGLREIPLRRMRERKPTELLRRAVKGMLKQNTVNGRNQMRRLRLFEGEEHTHEAQTPIKVEI